MYEMKGIYLEKNGQGRYGLNEFPKVNEKGNADKKFCKWNKKIAEQENLLGYCRIKPKVFVR